MKKTITKAIDWTKVKSGYYFTCSLNKNKCSGIIEKKGTKIFLCQDYHNGDKANDKHGYRYSWTIGNGSDVAHYDTTNLKISKTKPIGFKEPKHIMIGNHKTVIKKGHIIVGCTRVNNSEIRSIVKKLKD